MKYSSIILLVFPFFIAACSTSFPEVKPGKIHKRYFAYSKNEFAYSLLPPTKPWRYMEPKYEAIDKITFLGQTSFGVSVEVEFGLRELFLKSDRTDDIGANKYFFRNGRFGEPVDNNSSVTISIGTQGVRCIKNKIAWQQHYGPSTDPNVSGQWAGKGNTRYSYQVICPFHMDDRYFWFVMDKSYIVPDSLTVDDKNVDVKMIDNEIDRQFEPVLKSILFSPAFSQSVLP